MPSVGDSLFFSSSCEEFAQRGCIVYATARKVGSMEGMSHASVRHRAMDVTDDESVQNTVNEIIAAEGRLDILVNNAGVICIGAFSTHMKTVPG